MSEHTRIRGTVVTSNGKFFHKEDTIDMEIHDAVDYINLKYITKGNRLQALPARLVTEMSREEERIKEDKYI